jgi:3-hydroxybutyryl-CoA dehydrogenase
MKIGVIGAGAMGTGIAQVAAEAGHSVYVYDTRDVALVQAKQKLHATFNKLVEKGKFTTQYAQDVLQRILFEDNLLDFAECGLVIEAIVERLDAKRSVFKSLESIVSDNCILATNTSSLSIAAISSGLKKPSRLIGIHFFNPAPLMPLVEIVPCLQTADEVTQTAEALIKSWKKVTVLTKDTPGFIVNRVARPFYSEAIKMFEEGFADMATIDWAMREIGGFRMGPFELMDLIGHDVNYVVTETVWKQFYYDPRFKPSITQKRLLEAGLLGRKSGKGFYDYSNGAQNPSFNADNILGQQIVDRILALLINEAADAVFMQIGTPKDIDLAMTKGVNYPKGLLQWANEIGLSVVLNRLEELHAFYGDDRYRPNPLIRKKVAAKETFAL